MVRMRLTTARATLLASWVPGDIISVTEEEASRLEASGSAERLEELETAVASKATERAIKGPRKARGRPS